MFREQLLTALKSAVQDFNSGASDVDAVVKAAQAADFNPDQTQRLIETYNTTKTISMFKTAADRTVTFSTADPESVMAQLFDGKHLVQAKAAQAVPGPRIAYDYSEYDRPARFGGGVDTYDNYGVKSAVAPLPSMDSLARAAYHTIDNARASAEKLASDAGMMRVLYQRTLDKIASELVQDQFDPDKTEQALAYFKSAFPTQADAVIGDLMAKMPVSHATKVAADVRLSTFGAEYPMIDNEFATAVELNQGMAEMWACSASFAKTADEWQQEFEKVACLTPEEPSTQDKEVGELFAPGFREKVAKSSYETISPWDQLTNAEEPRKIKVDQETPIESIFNLGIKTVGSGAESEAPRMLPKVLAGPAIREEDKSKKRLRNFQRQIMLEDLLSTDPILQGIPPEIALRSYGALLRLAPELSLNKEVVRSILRTTTNSESMSPFDAKQLADVENVMRKNLALQSGGQATKGKEYLMS